MTIRYFRIYFVPNLTCRLNFDTMHYLITGGAGFIGSNLIRHLFASKQEISVTCLHDFDPFYSEEIKQLNICGFKDNPNFRLLNEVISTTSPKELAKKIGSPVDVIV